MLNGGWHRWTPLQVHGNWSRAKPLERTPQGIPVFEACPACRTLRTVLYRL